MDSSFNKPDSPPDVVAGNGQATQDSPATERFKSCRWRKPAEEGIPDHCTHRDVLPMAGTAGFVPESWCPDCTFYKARRVPKKREPEADTWRRW